MIQRAFYFGLGFYLSFDMSATNYTIIKKNLFEPVQNDYQKNSLNSLKNIPGYVSTTINKLAK